MSSMVKVGLLVQITGSCRCKSCISLPVYFVHSHFFIFLKREIYLAFRCKFFAAKFVVSATTLYVIISNLSALLNSIS